MTATIVGIDLAKNMFAVHCVDQNGETVLVKPKVSRAAFPELIISLSPCVIGIEMCSNVHYWARVSRQYGHEPHLTAAKFISPYRAAGKSGKGDAADTQAIYEATRHSYMRLMLVKDENQQAIQCLHRTKRSFIEEETTTYSRSKGLMSEFGIIAPQSIDALRHIVSEQKSSLPLQVQQCVDGLLEHISRIEDNIVEYDRIPSHTAKTDHRSQRLMGPKGIDPTMACALVVSIGNAHGLKNGRQLVARLGLTPSQYSSGGKPKLDRITKAGGSYL